MKGLLAWGTEIERRNSERGEMAMRCEGAGWGMQAGRKEMLVGLYPRFSKPRQLIHMFFNYYKFITHNIFFKHFIGSYNF